MTPLFTILTAPTPSGALVLASGDTNDFLKVNGFARHTGWLHGVMTQYAGKGVALFALLLVGGYLLARSRGQMLLLARALLAGAGVLLAVAVNQPARAPPRHPSQCRLLAVRCGWWRGRAVARGRRVAALGCSW